MRGSRFYLAFENDLCAGYVSEKPLRAFKHGVVPIVYGAERTDYARALPPGSFIAAGDFATPEALAEEVAAVDADEERYRTLSRAWRRSSCKSNIFSKRIVQNVLNIFETLLYTLSLERCNGLESQMEKSLENMQMFLNLVDLEKYCRMSIWLLQCKSRHRYSRERTVY